MSEESNAGSGSKGMALVEKTKIYLRISPIRKKNNLVGEVNKIETNCGRLEEQCVQFYIAPV